jgi:hypothetical protein
MIQAGFFFCAVAALWAAEREALWRTPVQPQRANVGWFLQLPSGLMF